MAQIRYEYRSVPHQGGVAVSLVIEDDNEIDFLQKVRELEADGRFHDYLPVAKTEDD